MNYETSVTADEPRELHGGPDLHAEQPRSRRKWIIVALVVLVAAIAAYLAFGRGGGEDAPAGPQLPLVTVVAPGRVTVEGKIAATGTIGARREIPVGAVGEGGRVVSVAVDQGSWVRQGQVLVAIDR